jgi:hypothetical protein
VEYRSKTEDGRDLDRLRKTVTYMSKGSAWEMCRWTSRNNLINSIQFAEINSAYTVLFRANLKDSASFSQMFLIIEDVAIVSQAAFIRAKMIFIMFV